MYNVQIDDEQVDKYIKPIFDFLEKKDPTLTLSKEMFFELNKSMYFYLLPKKLIEEKDFILRCLDENLISISDVPENLKNKDVISKDLYMKNTEIFFVNLRENLYEQDKEIAERALKNEYSYAYIEERFKNDEELLIRALKSNPNIFSFLEKPLKEKILQNNDLVIELLKKQPAFFEQLSEENKRKDDILLTTINSGERDKGFNICKEYLKMNKSKEVALAALLGRDYARKQIHQIYVSILKKNNIKENCYNFLKIYLNNKELNNEIIRKENTKEQKMKI